jgi:hypothetical protein
MNRNTTTALSGWATAAFVLTGVLLTSAGSTGIAQVENSASKNGLAGAWFVEGIRRNCDTGAPLGTFNSLVTFHRGGTLSESTTGTGFAIGQRGPGTGVWASEGPNEYSQRMAALINFDTAANLPGTPGFDLSLPVSPGFFTGWSTVTHTIEMADADHFTSSGTNAFHKGDGSLYRTGCSTAAGTRFE